MKTLRNLVAGFCLLAASATAAQTQTPAPAARPTIPALPTFAEEPVGDRFPGAFFAKPQGMGPHPVVVLLGGSEGNDMFARMNAPLFLAQGYAVLGLPYYAPVWGPQPSRFPTLPANFVDIPVERAGQAREWLCARTDVRCDRIGLYGVSKGAEYALLATSLEKNSAGFAAIAAIVPTDVVWEGWGMGVPFGQRSSFSWQGKPLPFVPYIGMAEEFAKFATAPATVRLRVPHDRGRHANPDRAVAARIKVEAIKAPVLVAGGDADNTWNSGEMAQTIAERRAEVGLETTALIYTDSGHGLAGDGANPNGWYSDKDVAAQKEIWPATLAFFAKHLKK